VNFVLIDVEHVGAQTVDRPPLGVFLQNQVDADVIFINPDVFQRGDLFMQRPFDFLAGEVFGMKNPAAMVAPFLAQVIKVGRLFRFREIDAPFDQLLNARRRFPHDKLNDVLPAEACAAFQRVADVLFKAVGLVRYRGDAALGIVGVGFRFFLFGDNGDRSELRHFDGEAEPRDPAADDEEVRFYFHERRARSFLPLKVCLQMPGAFI